MRNGDQRRSFCHPITLQNGKTQSTPEFFCWCFKRCASTNERPKLPPEGAMHSSEDPPSLPERFVSCRCKFLFELFVLSVQGRSALRPLSQGVQNARHNYCCRNPVCSHSLHDLGRIH